ncbi:efflux RND transporter periplasmic adaptor subunit [Methylobacterium sp. ID0610]|uniref:efflux RND transporter periplasmic adaptor subunit n=1 Tax=Methylobacterium carpenticola TaxID=3344827 RepID=UPI003673F8D3
MLVQRHRLPAPAAAALLLLSGCNDPAPPATGEIRPVRVVTVDQRNDGEDVSLTGTVQPQVEVNLAFRIDGRMIERRVSVGDGVTAGQIVARLDPENERNAVRAAQAAVVAATGQSDEARNNYERQRELLAGGWTTRVRYDQALQLQNTTRAQLDAAEAQLRIAEERAGDTELRADAPGTVTQRGAEQGEIVRAGQMIVQIARQDGKDAVFDVPASIKDRAPADPAITVALTMDAAVTARGRVREIAPRADPVTGTFQVRVGLTDPPPQMRLGAAVTGRMRIGRDGGLEIPASALLSEGEHPAVWIVDPATMTVGLRTVELARFDQSRALVARGLAPGDVVVTAGVHALRPGQKVRLLGAAS